MEIIINLIIKIFILTGVGYYVKKRKIITQQVQSGLNQLLVRIILPFTIIVSSQNNLTLDVVDNMYRVIIIVLVYYILSLIVMKRISRAFGLSENSKSIFVTMVVFANVGFIGFPIISELYGMEGTMYTVIYNMIYQLFFFTIGISMLKGDKNFSLKVILRTPVTWASIICVFLFVVQIKIPEAILYSLQAVGNMTTPLSLMLVGCSICDSDIKAILLDKYAYLVSLFRMIILPICMFIVLKVLGLPQEVAGVCIVLTALPSGSLNVIYASEYDCDPEFASCAVVQTMCLMCVTLPLTMLSINLFY